MKQFIFTEDDRKEVIYLLNNHSIFGAKNYLNQLQEITSQSQRPKPEEAGYKENGAKETSNNSSANKDNEAREKQDKLATPSHTSKEQGGLKR